MSKHLDRTVVARQAEIHEQVPVRHEVDRTFEIPRGVYGLTVGCYLGFLAIMAAGFGNPGLAIPMVIFAFFVVAGFGVPALWTRIHPDSRKPAMTYSRFRTQGISTLTGRLSAGEAMAQVLVLPVLIFLWGLTMVAIAALV